MFRKLPITIRAALISGVFVIAAVPLGFFLNWLLLQNKEAKQEELGNVLEAPPEQLPKAQRQATVAAARAKYPGFCAQEDEVSWFDFAGRGKATEFYACYSSETQSCVLDVFTLRGNEVERLLHQLGRAEELQAAHVTLESRPFLICSSKTGSGGFLSFLIYDYAGVSKPRLCYKSDSFFSGHLFVVGNRVLIKTSSQRLELLLKNGEFQLLRVAERLSSLEYGTHVLRFDIEDNALKISFDGERLEFAKSQHDTWTSKRVICIEPEAEVLLDDNFSASERQVRVLATHGELRWHNGFFSSFTPEATGATQLAISDQYDKWYHVRLQITAFLPATNSERPLE